MTTESSADSLFHKLDALGRIIENIFLTVLLAGMIGLSATQIFLRWGGVGSISWGDEGVRLMVLWIAMIAGIASAREDRHISIDLLSRFMPERGKAVGALVVDLFTVAVCLALAWYGYEMVAIAYEFEDVLLGDMPAWFFQAIVPVGFLLIAYRYLIWVVRRIRQIFAGVAG